MVESIPDAINFFELAPENWIGLGGRLGRQLSAISEQCPIIAHGLSLSIGGPAPLDHQLITDIGQFIQRHNVALYSEHLSYSNDGGQLYDLLPLPFTEEAVHYCADRIKKVQDMLGQQIAMENVSYYLTPKKDMGELEFVTSVIEEADCLMLLDVNNVYVNSINHGFEPMDFIRQVPADRIAYLHVAGHYLEDDGLIIDTHGADVIDPVWDLLEKTYKTIGNRPTLLERDFNIPPIEELLNEINFINQLQASNHEAVTG